MADRADPALTVAYAVLAVNKEARHRGANAGTGRLTLHPGRSEAIAAEAGAWIEAAAPRRATLDELAGALDGRIAERAARDGTVATLTAESVTDPVRFHEDLCLRLAAVLGDAPRVATAATHVAGALAASVPTAMLLVRNPGAVYDTPAERADDVDCAAGTAALATVLGDLAGPNDLPEVSR
jgi:N-carbamoyl-L-amino-acid hydrolase